MTRLIPLFRSFFYYLSFKMLKEKDACMFEGAFNFY